MPSNIAKEPSRNCTGQFLPFLGKARGRPCEKLKRAVKGRVVEVAWSALETTISRWLRRPETSKMAAKVINRYGEALMAEEVCPAGKRFALSEAVPPRRGL